VLVVPLMDVLGRRKVLLSILPILVSSLVALSLALDPRVTSGMLRVRVRERGGGGRGDGEGGGGEERQRERERERETAVLLTELINARPLMLTYPQWGRATRLRRC
jgi:hypothetical protein